jgi:hypothetical protein
MAIAMLLDWPGMDKERYVGLVAALALGDEMFPGAMVHVAGQHDGGWRVVDVWDSQAAFDRFRDTKLASALRETGLSPPAADVWAVHTLRTPQGIPRPRE